MKLKEQAIQTTSLIERMLSTTFCDEWKLIPSPESPWDTRHQMQWDDVNIKGSNRET
jgi:hypothetical protein